MITLAEVEYCAIRFNTHAAQRSNRSNLHPLTSVAVSSLPVMAIILQSSLLPQVTTAPQSRSSTSMYIRSGFPGVTNPSYTRQYTSAITSFKTAVCSGNHLFPPSAPNNFVRGRICLQKSGIKCPAKFNHPIIPYSSLTEEGSIICINLANAFLPI